MKKLIYLLFITIFFFGCSNLNNKLESAVSKEVGNKPTKNETVSKTKTQIILWENVKLNKSDLIKNTVDKQFGSLPIKTSELNQELDSDFNPIEGVLNQYQVYENT